MRLLDSWPDILECVAYWMVRNILSKIGEYQIVGRAAE